MPPFPIPPGATTTVRIIDSTASMKLPIEPFMSPPMPGFTHLISPAYAFLVEHASGRKILFDLGVRKDWENMAGPVVAMIKGFGWEVRAERNVIDIIGEEGIKGGDVEGVVWSHWHFDHLGDPSLFPHSTALIVGPGFKRAFTPGFPDNPKSPIRTSDYAGRELREITFDADSPTIGSFRAHDYFGDGSFYLLDAPGHAIGHLCGLARTSTDPDDFIFMGADFAHHGGEFRPSPLLPIPSSIVPNPLDRYVHASACPGHMFEDLNIARGRRKDEPFFEIARPEGGRAIAHDADETERTIGKVQVWDPREDVFVVTAHDSSLMDILDFFPKSANGWREQGMAKKGKWAFLRDFEKAAGSVGSKI